MCVYDDMVSNPPPLPLCSPDLSLHGYQEARWQAFSARGYRGLIEVLLAFYSSLFRGLSIIAATSASPCIHMYAHTHTHPHIHTSTHPHIHTRERSLLNYPDSPHNMTS